MERKGSGVVVSTAVESTVGASEPDAPHDVIRVCEPYLITYTDGHGVTCRIHPPPGYTYKEYGLLVCDLVRHVARAFNVDDNAVWKWVDRERRNPTTDVTRPS